MHVSYYQQKQEQENEVQEGEFLILAESHIYISVNWL